VPTEPEILTLAEAARRAAEAVDPDGNDDAVNDFVARFEDRDEPITAVADIEELIAEATHRIDVDESDPALTLAGAVVTYLRFKRDGVDTDDERLLQLAADAEFEGNPPPAVAAFLEGA
jgi:putative intracellular protease/amidase